MLHLLSDQRDDGKIPDDLNRAELLQLPSTLSQLMGSNISGKSHGDMDLGGGNQVDNELVLLQDVEDIGKEIMRQGLLVGVDVENHGVTLYSNSSWSLGAVLQESILAEHADVSWNLRWSLLSLSRDGIWENDGSLPLWSHNVLDSDGDTFPDSLLHGEGMDDLGTEVGQFGGFFGGDGLDQPCSRDLSGVGSENSVNFLPNLELVGLQSDGDESSAKIGVSTTNLSEQTAWDSSKVTYPSLDPEKTIHVPVHIPVMTGTLSPTSFTL